MRRASSRDYAGVLDKVRAELSALIANWPESEKQKQEPPHLALKSQGHDARRAEPR